MNADRIGSVAIGLIALVILGSFFSPDVRTMMGFGQSQAQQGQAQESQSQQSAAAAGATKSSSATPQGPKLNFQYEPGAQKASGDLPYQMTIWATTDGAMQGFQLRIICDAACTFQSADVNENVSSITSRPINDRTIEVAVNHGLDSNQKCRIVLRGKTAFHISTIDKI